MTGNVFEEHGERLELSDNPGDVGPEVALVTFGEALSGGTKWLAGISREERVDLPPEGTAVKAGDIIPDRGGHEISRALCGDKGFPARGFPLDETSGFISGLGEHEAEIQASAA